MLSNNAFQTEIQNVLESETPGKREAFCFASRLNLVTTPNAQLAIEAEPLTSNEVFFGTLIGER